MGSFYTGSTISFTFLLFLPLESRLYYTFVSFRCVVVALKLIVVFCYVFYCAAQSYYCSRWPVFFLLPDITRGWAGFSKVGRRKQLFVGCIIKHISFLSCMWYHVCSLLLALVSYEINSRFFIMALTSPVGLPPSLTSLVDAQDSLGRGRR